MGQTGKDAATPRLSEPLLSQVLVTVALGLLLSHPEALPAYASEHSAPPGSGRGCTRSMSGAILSKAVIYGTEAGLLKHLLCQIPAVPYTLKEGVRLCTCLQRFWASVPCECRRSGQCCACQVHWLPVIMLSHLQPLSHQSRTPLADRGYSWSIPSCLWSELYAP